MAIGMTHNSTTLLFEINILFRTMVRTGIIAQMNSLIKYAHLLSNNTPQFNSILLCAEFNNSSINDKWYKNNPKTTTTIINDNPEPLIVNPAIVCCSERVD